MPTLTRTIITLLIVAGCDAQPIEPWGPCARSGDVVACPLDHRCLEGAAGDMCVPLCVDDPTRAPELACEEDGVGSGAVPLGQEFACVDAGGDSVCAALCSESAPCGAGQVCDAGVCLWPSGRGLVGEAADL